MILAGTDKLDEFVKRQPPARGPIQAWRAEAQQVIFNIGGNKYMFVVQIAYKTRVVMVVWVGTHRDYDKMNF